MTFSAFQLPPCLLRWNCCSTSNPFQRNFIQKWQPANGPVRRTLSFQQVIDIVLEWMSQENHHVKVEFGNAYNGEFERAIQRLQCQTKGEYTLRRGHESVIIPYDLETGGEFLLF